MLLLFAAQLDPGAGPDRGAKPTPPSVFHGNWRVMAADDESRQATMRVDIQHSPGERSGTGSYALYQPFCDLVTGSRIIGTADCELTGQGGEATVRAEAGRMIVVFTPTAEGAEHRLVLRRSGALLIGSYRHGDYRRTVRLERTPE